MFNRSRKPKLSSNESEEIATHPPGEVFRWPKGARLTAIDMLILALPKALFQCGETMSSVIDAEHGMNIALPPDSDNVYLYVQPGTSVTLKKSSQAYLVANDKNPRRMRITIPKT
jgi:hypothetical protein